MKKTIIQKRVVRSLNKLTTLLANKVVSAPKPYDLAFWRNKPVSIIGQALKEAGVSMRIARDITALDRVFGSTENPLPTEVRLAVDALTNSIANNRKNTRRAAVQALPKLTEAIKTANFRKPYTKTGKYVQTQTQTTTTRY